ncbi:RagB/SusD family nutrient uptake outer membrane protein [Mucilaginibacter sp. AW1-7]|uniref:RagB/SusD family nutrient uptake outer membrane protein n=1 Tax=Mucilaginibacter sp. AW1-7 TaxID=3349874 RepID=UPI003F7359C1
MKTFCKNTFSLFIGLMLLSSCRKFVQIAPSETVVATANVFDKNSTATAAQLSIYAQMQSNSYPMKRMTGLSSDELKNYSSNTTSINLYANNLNVTNDAQTIGIWKTGFNFIYQANAIIENLSNSPGINLSVKRQLTGESKFIRAYWNFNLVNLYGDIPIVTTTNYVSNATLSRSSKTEVYAQIVADLTEAQALLNSNFVDVTDTVITTERIRPTKWAATALLARSYLYMGDWANAEAQATAVINNASLFSLPSNLNSVFLKNSTEAIFQLQSPSTSTFTDEGSFVLTSSPITNSGSLNALALSDFLLNSFEVGDARRNSWVGTFSSWFFCNKYKANSTTVSATPALANTEYTTILRLAEQYLIRAEAIARKGTNLADAIADLNIIRRRAGLPNYAGPIDQVSVINAIMHERQIELFAEGFRWFDLKRTNTIDAVMTNAAIQKGTVWKSYQQLYPIPAVDIDNSVGKITQNNGY